MGNSSGYMKTLLVARIHAICFGKHGNSLAVERMNGSGQTSLWTDPVLHNQLLGNTVCFHRKTTNCIFGTNSLEGFIY